MKDDDILPIAVVERGNYLTLRFRNDLLNGDTVYGFEKKSGAQSCLNGRRRRFNRFDENLAAEQIDVNTDASFGEKCGQELFQVIIGCNKEMRKSEFEQHGVDQSAELGITFCFCNPGFIPVMNFSPVKTAEGRIIMFFVDHPPHGLKTYHVKILGCRDLQEHEGKNSG